MTRDEAYLKVYKLIRYYAIRFSATSGLDRDDVFQEFTTYFLSRYHQFNGDERHLATFAKWMCLNAGRASRTKNSVRLNALSEYQPVPDTDHRPERVVEDAEMAKLVREAVAALPPGPRELISRRFGLDGGPPAKLAELAAKDGVTVWGASCRVRSVLTRLRFTLAGAVDPDTRVAAGV